MNKLIINDIEVNFSKCSLIGKSLYGKIMNVNEDSRKDYVLGVMHTLKLLKTNLTQEDIKMLNAFIK